MSPRLEDIELQPTVIHDGQGLRDRLYIGVRKPLVIGNDSLRSLPISGRFRVGDTDSVRFLLRERFDVQSVVDENRIVLR